MKKTVLYMLGLALLLSSCGTATLSSYPGVGRIKTYNFYSEEIPEAFDGFRIGFASDFHYKSKYKERGLENTVRAMKQIHPDILLLGGDYQEGCEDGETLICQLSRIETPYGTYGVMGNNDYERCHDELVAAMEQHGMKVLEHKNDTITIEGQRIILSGIRNPFDLKRNGISPTLELKPEDFVIMLTHTPDYAEDADVSNTDLVLAGHTHGGQVTLGRWVVPYTNSKYGKKFLSGRTQTSKGIPVITTNGLGTSKIKFRMFVPSEVVLIVLHKGKLN